MGYVNVAEGKNGMDKIIENFLDLTYVGKKSFDLFQE